MKEWKKEGKIRKWRSRERQNTRNFIGRLIRETTERGNDYSVRQCKI